MPGDSLRERLKTRARELGFSSAGVAPAVPSPTLNAYLRWLRAGMHGEMAYLARPDRLARRADLSLVLPGARSLFIVTLDYPALRPAEPALANPERGRISAYAFGPDYHDRMLSGLNALIETLYAETGQPVGARAYVDTGAFLERAHAAGAGLGFTGKNTMLIHPRRGSYFFIGLIITAAALEHDPPPPMPGCGSCARCLAACPTAAFPAPFVLDARRCISYLTIEHRGAIPADLRPSMGSWVYGCDICQEVCPWQRFAAPALSLQPDQVAPRLDDLLTLTPDEYMRRFRGTAVWRIGRERLVRNACIAAGNSGLPALVSPLAGLLADASALIRGHAAWALGRLGAPAALLECALAAEENEEVRHELAAALQALANMS